ncbi:MAG: tyrosine-protein kinase family protein [Candidatus Binataceae bacterium]
MSKYYDAIRRTTPRAHLSPEDLRPRSEFDPVPEERQREAEAGAQPRQTSNAVMPLPVVPMALSAAARAEEIRRLSERLAPLAVVEHSMRLLVSGCRRGDGASTIAASLALDLSQRLALRTLLVDAHLRSPALHRMFGTPVSKSPEMLLGGAVQLRATGWPRLELASCSLGGADSERHELLGTFENLLGHYQAAVIDLGVTRLDARMLSLARPDDPILLVVRYGHTERRELATANAALQAANRAVAGVILNAATNPVAKKSGKLIRQ